MVLNSNHKNVELEPAPESRSSQEDKSYFSSKKNMDGLMLSGAVEEGPKRGSEHCKSEFCLGTQ